MADGPARKPRRRSHAFSTTLLVLAVLTTIAAGAFLYGASRYVDRLPTLDAIKAREIGANSSVFDARGNSLGVLANEENRQPVTSDEISPWMKKGTVAIEDRRYYEHSGVDPLGISRALVENVMAGRVVQGGSTLTQQLISQIYIVKQRTLDRKVREAVLAVQLEDRFTKDEILTAYLNTVFYGNNAYGIEAAAQTYFAKPAKELTLAQAALLSGLPQLPSTYDPYLYPEAALKRRSQVLQAMRETGVITARQEAKANATPLKLKRGKVYGKVSESFFVRYVADELGRKPDFGGAAVRAGGLQIETTLDPVLQRKARNAMRKILKTPGDPDAAIVAIRPKTGQIVAMASTRYFRKVAASPGPPSRRSPSQRRSNRASTRVPRPTCPRRSRGSRMTTRRSGRSGRREASTPGRSPWKTPRSPPTTPSTRSSPLTSGRRTSSTWPSASACAPRRWSPFRP
jgi:penicillin-binding protein 1A